MIPLRTSAPRYRSPTVVLALIAINTVVFLIQVSLPDPLSHALVIHYALVPLRYANPYWAVAVGLDPGDRLPLLTNIFMHGGWLHLIANMWTLWLFGAAVEGRMGSLRFLIFYLVCGVLASWAHLLVYADSRIPTLGASGAIAAVLGAHVTLFPQSRVLLLIPIVVIPLIVPVPVMIYATLWFVLQILQGTGDLLQPSMGGGVAWWAHIGGFLAGLAMVRFITPPLRGPWSR